MKTWMNVRRVGMMFVMSLMLCGSSLYAQEKVIVSGHPEYAPFMWREGEKIVGVGIEAVEMIFHDLGLEVESQYVGPWKRMLFSLETGKVDVLCAGYVTAERQQYAEFTTEPLSDDPTAIFVWHANVFPFETWDDLKGKRFGELLGESQGEEFDAWRKKNATVEEVPTRLMNFKKLEANRIDAFVTGLYGGILHVKKEGYEGKIIPLETPLRTEYVYIAVSKKSKYLSYLPQIDEKLRELHQNGTIDRLLKKYLDYYAATQLEEKKKEGK